MSFNVNRVESIEKTKYSSSAVDTTSHKMLFNFDVNPPADSIVKKNMWSEETKACLFDATQSMGISNYTPSILKDNNVAVSKAQTHLFDLMKYYEGDRYHYYEAITNPYRDKFGHWTCGFGTLTKNSLTQEQAYKIKCDTLKKFTNEVRTLINTRVGKNSYNELPNSIKEGLIDLCYNKGLSKISQNKNLLQALKLKDYSTVIAELKYVYSGSSNADKSKEDAGLYRRSLNRMILASRDLKGNELEQAKKEIKLVYEKALKIAKPADKPEVEKIYEYFSTKKITSKENSVESFKYEITDKYKGKGLFAVAQEIYKSFNNPKVSFKTFFEELKRINYDEETITIGAKINVPYLKNLVVTSNVSNATEVVADVSDNVVKTDKKVNTESKIEKDTTTKDNTIDNDTIKIEQKIKTNNQEKTTSWFGQIKSYFVKLYNYICNLFTDDKDVIQDDFNDLDLSKPAFQRLVNSKNTTIETDGDFEIITTKYKIRKGDGVWRLAQTYNLDEDVFCNINNIQDRNKINIDQIVNIQKLGYKIKSGDTLYQISKKFGIDVETLKDMNNIEDETALKVGQMLELPGFLHVVEKGENLSIIARKVRMDVQVLMKINNLTSTLIKPGDKIKIVYNEGDYSIPDKNRSIKIDKETNAKIETLKVESQNSLETRPLLKEKKKINGKVVATRKVFEPTKQGKLSGKTIIINAGHGYTASGKVDSGTPGINGMDHEYLLNYDNAMRLKDELCIQGAKVVFLQGKRNLIIDELKKKNNKANLFVSIHVNSGGQNPIDRTEVFIRTEDFNANNKSAKFAKIIDKNLDQWISENEKISKSEKFISPSTKKQDYAQVRHESRKKQGKNYRLGLLDFVAKSQGNIPSLIWEVAYMNSAKGRERLSDDKIMDNYAKAMANSIIEVLK